MSLLDKRTSADLVRLVIFIVVTTLATGILVVVIGNITFQSTNSYKAIFSDVTGLNSGDDVRIAGVRVGSVEGINIIDRNHAEVTFSASTSAFLNKSETATIRYRNLVGQRYLSLAEGSGPATPLPSNGSGVIPLSQTFPALDLTVLFNGFKPLFAALSPADINQLSYEMIQVFQGEGNNLNGLLQTTASITSALADRDQVIGSLITNLNTVLGTVNQRNSEFNNLITQFQTFLRGLVKDKDALLGPLDSISQLTTQTADLVAGARPGFVQDIKGLRALAGNLNRNAALIDKELQILPIKLNKIGRTAEYGSFFNFYLCQLQGHVIGLGLNIPLKLDVPNQPRCNLSGSGVTP
jgi:phospholipid/cholesterol/gamma-HCH transport system substrate-binding protein